MKNNVFIKKLNIITDENNTPKSLITINNIDILVYGQSDLKLIEGNNYELFIDISPRKPDHEGYQNFFLTYEPIQDELNESAEFLTSGKITEDDFNNLFANKVGFFESENEDGYPCYKFIGQAQDEYLVTNDIYFYIGKNREVQNGKFCIAYCETPYICEKISDL